MLLLHGPVVDLLAGWSEPTTSIGISGPTSPGSQQAPTATGTGSLPANQTPRPPSEPARSSSGLPSPVVAVPGVVGLALDPARSTLQAAGLTVGRVSVRNGVSRDQVGAVLDQIPAAGRSVAAGTPVALTVTGVPAPILVIVPRVVGEKLHPAELQLRAKGLALGRVSVRNGVPQDQVGVVLDQDPAAARTVDPGSAVALTVGGVPAPTLVTVPYLIGLTQEQARLTLESEGLTLGAISLKSGVLAPVPPGVVLDQTPAPGTSVKPGNPVALTVGYR